MDKLNILIMVEKIGKRKTLETKQHQADKLKEFRDSQLTDDLAHIVSSFETQAVELATKARNFILAEISRLDISPFDQNEAGRVLWGLQRLEKTYNQSLYNVTLQLAASYDGKDNFDSKSIELGVEEQDKLSSANKRYQSGILFMLSSYANKVDQDIETILATFGIVKPDIEAKEVHES